jgi:DNA replication initiation complex subunit (GINS family)
MDSPWVSLSADTGDDSDGITNSAALTVSPLASGVKRSFSVNTASATTSYTAPTVDGEYTVLVTDTDSTGETASAEVSFTLDRRIATPKLSLEDDTGISKTDNISSKAAVVCPIDTSEETTRNYALTPNGATQPTIQGPDYQAPEEDGKYLLLVTDTDTAGNKSYASLTFTLDTQIDQPTAALKLDTGADVSDLRTRSAELSLSTLALYVTRTFSINDLPPTSAYISPLVDGEYTVVVTDTDAAGNTASTVDDPLRFTLDMTIAKPTVVLTTDSGKDSDNITNDASMTWSETDWDVTRNIVVNGSDKGSSYDGPTIDGTYVLVVTDTDLAGNSLSASLTFTLDTTATAPTVSLTSDTGNTQDNVSRDARLTIAGALGVTRTFSFDDGNTVTSSYTVPTADGEYTVLVTDTDTAGNTASTYLTFTLDKTITKPTVSLETDTANPTDNISSQTYLLWSDPESDVTRSIVVNGETKGSSYDSPSEDGTYVLVVSDTDTAGNTDTATLTFTLDTTLQTPTIRLASYIGDPWNTTSNSAVLKLSTPASDVTRSFSINGAEPTANYSTPTVNGDYNVLVTDTDKAGNTDSASLTFTLDKSPTSTGKTVDVSAYTWSTHALLNDVVISHGGNSLSTSAGAVEFTGVTDTSMILAASRAIPTSGAEAIATKSAVNLQDSIAILKMIVGLDVNGANKALSPYQALAADFDGNGKVELTDAIGVLKHVVGLAAFQPAWHFVNELDPSVPNLPKLAPGVPQTSVIASLDAESPVHVGLVGYLSGDVDGSYALGSGNVPESYFRTLVSEHPTELSLSQFGIYT